MKKWKVLLSALVIVLAVGMFTQTAYAAEDATVHEVDDITDVSGLTADVYQVGIGKYEETIKFHLDKPADVYLKGSSNVAADFYNLGTIEHFAVYSDEACTKRVSGDKVEAIWFEEVKEKFLSLDAGDYWVKVAKANEEGDWTSEEDDAKSSGQFTLIVAAQYLDTDGTEDDTKNDTKNESTYAAEEVTVHKVDDITDVSGLTADVYQVGTGKYEETIKFHLDKPAYVCVKGTSDVATDFYNLGTIEHFAVYTDEACTNRVLGDKVEAIWFEGVKEKFLCLDAGDYWVKVAKENREDSAEYDAVSSGEFTLTVAAQYLNVDGTKNTSKAKAQKIDVNTDVTGFLSSTTRNSWFRFDIKTDNTIVNFGMSLKNAFEGKEGYEPDYTGFIVYDSKDNIIANWNIESEYNNTVLTDTYTFKKGTYYVKFTGDNAWDDWGDLYKLEVNNKGVVNLHVTAVEVPAVKSWKNTGKSKAKVTYSKATLPEGYEVQYATKSDFSDAKVKKVKAKKAKAAISKLKKGSTYYVRVRAWSYDVFDEVVYGNWSAAKSVKITK